MEPLMNRSFHFLFHYPYITQYTVVVSIFFSILPIYLNPRVWGCRLAAFMDQILESWASESFQWSFVCLGLKLVQTGRFGIPGA